MPNLNPELQKAIENIETFKRLVTEKVADATRKTNLLGLIDGLEETLILAPCSTRTEFQGAFAGGLVDHSLKVLKTMSALNRAYEANIGTESLVVAGLFHDIGKCGSEGRPYYLPKNSEWHNKQGIMYEVNPDMINMPVSLRSLFLLQSAGVRLTSDEHYAISTVKDRIRTTDENLFVPNEPMLAVVLQQAIRVVCLKGSGRTSLLS
jgi:putative nucleotidyltransferase with HDIG domain